MREIYPPWNARESISLKCEKRFAASLWNNIAHIHSQPTSVPFLSKSFSYNFKIHNQSQHYFCSNFPSAPVRQLPLTSIIPALSASSILQDGQMYEHSASVSNLSLSLSRCVCRRWARAHIRLFQGQALQSWSHQQSASSSVRMGGRVPSSWMGVDGGLLHTSPQVLW